MQITLSNSAYNCLREEMKKIIEEILDDPSHLYNHPDTEIPHLVDLMELAKAVFPDRIGFLGIVFEHDNDEERKRFLKIWDEKLAAKIWEEVQKRKEGHP